MGPRKTKDDGEEVTLMYSKHEKIQMKDFSAEIRATLDIAHFLNQAVLLLDLTETNLECVVELMLHKMLDAEEPQCTVAEAKSLLFTSDSALHLLSRTIQGACSTEGGTNFDYDQSWICALCNLPTLQRRRVAITRLKHPANFGRTSYEVRLFVLVICPSKEKGTKNAVEMGRTFSTILADINFRQKLIEAHTEEEFKQLILKQTHQLAYEQSKAEKRCDDDNGDGQDYEYEEKLCQFGRGIRGDIFRRLPHYISDYRDGFMDTRTIHKIISTTMFLYFACVLPAIAFGVLNDHNTEGKIDVKKVIAGQTIGGIFYVVFSGQPLLILLTTAPLALYIKIIHIISEDFDLDFFAVYCCVGLWNSLFLVIYALFDVSRIMHWSTRSTEEIFAFFISIAFCVDASGDTIKSFKQYYYSPVCKGNISSERFNISASTLSLPCSRESSILFLLLMLGTLWLSVSIYNFNKTPYLQASKREALADYSLPMAVITVSFIGSYFFGDVELERFQYSERPVFNISQLQKLSTKAVLGSGILGFALSVLFFMDQNITSAMVNNPCNKLKKGPAYHLDLFVVAILNAALSIFGLPWMHATLPHSPLHVRGLADVEERVDQGHVYEIIVKVRETRLTGLFSHILIGLSMFLLPYPLAYIPTAVLDGLFLYMAVTALNGNQMFERITLLFMEQAAYPPNHYIRRVPQRKIHAFTAFQVFQLIVMCVFGYAPVVYLKMIFPFIILFLLPVRHRLVPMFIEDRYLEALDGEHQ
ncbi:sodium bicarbonate transporter-like protein 11 isoform X2 [Cryptotermes secundus]|nr:sodium bicarbonate transporter-like protein 11 isoform X2 [Cryptotermes secundus]